MAQGAYNLRMRISLTKKIIHFILPIFNVTSLKAKINGQKSLEHRARMVQLFRIKQLIK